MVAAMAATCAIPLSKWLVFIRPSLAGFDCPLTNITVTLPATNSQMFYRLKVEQ